MCLEEVGLPHGHRRLRALASAAGAPSLTAPAPLALERGALLILHNVGLHTWECVGLDQYGRLRRLACRRFCRTLGLGPARGTLPCISTRVYTQTRKKKRDSILQNDVEIYM